MEHHGIWHKKTSNPSGVARIIHAIHMMHIVQSHILVHAPIAKNTCFEKYLKMQMHLYHIYYS